jgi:CheY-like chemotaxis protein
MLVGEGYDCVTAADGIEALTLAIDQRPACVLVDPEISGLDGPTLCQALRANPATALVPVVFISATYSMDLLQTALESGALDYLQKPLDGKILLARLLRCTSETYVLGQSLFLIADECPISFPSIVQSHAETQIYIEKPNWGEELNPFFGPGTFAELHHAAADFSIYRRRVILGREIPGEPPQMEVHVVSGVYRGQKRQTFRKAANLAVRYRLPNSFFRVANLVDVGGWGLRLMGVHDSAAAGDEIVIEMRQPAGLAPITGKVLWRGEPDTQGGIEVGLTLPEDIEAAWMRTLMLHLFQGQITAAPADATAG